MATDETSHHHHLYLGVGFGVGGVGGVGFGVGAGVGGGGLGVVGFGVGAGLVAWRRLWRRLGAGLVLVGAWGLCTNSTGWTIGGCGCSVVAP